MIPALAPAAAASNTLAPLLLSPLADQPMLLASVGYALTCNMAYLARRAHLRQMTVRQLWRVRTVREDGVSLPMYCTFLLAWQTFVLLLFPVTEPIGRAFGYCSFYYSYPNANGGGYIFEPLSVQRLPANRRAKAQLRFDWHRISYNVGTVGRNGYRHPPKVYRNVPHIDFPQKGVRHWPWRRRHRTEYCSAKDGAESDCTDAEAGQ